MVLVGSSTSKVPEETQPEWLDPAWQPCCYVFAA